MKHTFFLYITVATLVLGLDSCNKKPVHSVWVLHSFQEECPWVSDMNKAIRDAFADEDVKVKLHIDYLNSNYTPQRCRDTVNAMLNRMERPKVILSVNDQATRTLQAINHPYVNETGGCRIVFCGIDYPDQLSFEKHSNFSGFTSRINWSKTMQLATMYRLNKALVFVPDNPFYQTAVNEIVRQNEDANFTWPIELDSVSTSYHDVYYRMVSFRPQCFFLLPAWDAYRSEFIKSSMTPFLTLSNEGFGNGPLGGYFVPSYDQAYDGARRVARILKGYTSVGIVMQESEPFLMVDWNQLNRLDLPISKLPAGTQIINMPFYLKYERSLVILSTLAGFVFILLQALLIYKIWVYKKRQKKLEYRAKQEHDGLLVITDSINEGVILIRNDSTVSSLNAEARRLLLSSTPETAYLGRPLSELIEIVNASTSHGLQSLLDVVIDKKMTIKLPPFTTIQSKVSSHYFLADGEFTPLLDDADFNGVVFSFSDQTDIFTTQEFLELTSTIGGLFFWWYDFDSGNLIVDPSFFELFDLPDDGAHCMPMTAFLEAMNPADKEIWSERYAHQRFDRDIKTAMEVRLDFNGKGEEWWEVRLEYQANENIEAPPSLYGLCVNIQNYKKKQALLEEARENVHRSEQLKSAFLSNMSHEIRTPLNGIIGFAKLIAESNELDTDDHLLFVETIQTNCNLLLALIDDVLDLARIDSGSMVYNDSNCNLNELITQIMTTQQVILQKPLELITRLPEEPAVICVDRLRLNQVLTNLINNATKFTNEGSITVGYTSDEKQICLFVTDTGIGIAEDEQELIFDRFFKKHDDIQGAGIGLSLCKNIIEHYGGYITVDSRLGTGTTFTVYLPR